VTDAAPEIEPDPDEDRLTALESRVRALEARLGAQEPPPSATQVATAPSAPVQGSVPLDDTGAWLDQVASLAASGDRASAIALYRENMAADEQEAASFVDSLIADPPGRS
jgi:hypothetical protein